MTITLRPMLPRDLAAFDRIAASAFANGLTPLLFPNGKSEAAIAWSHAQWHRQMKKPYSRYNITIDSTLKPTPADLEGLDKEERAAAQAEGRIVSFGNWKIFDKERGREEMAAAEAEDEEFGLPPDSNQELFGAFVGAVGKAKKERFGGQPYVLLNVLATDPEHHRRGIGAMHLKWGLDEADRLGLPAYLEASEDGAPLYARWGFKPLGKLPLDTREFGFGRSVEFEMMLRPARAQTNGITNGMSNGTTNGVSNGA